MIYLKAILLIFLPPLLIASAWILLSEHVDSALFLAAFGRSHQVMALASAFMALGISAVVATRGMVFSDLLSEGERRKEEALAEAAQVQEDSASLKRIAESRIAEADEHLMDAHKFIEYANERFSAAEKEGLAAAKNTLEQAERECLQKAKRLVEVAESKTKAKDAQYIESQRFIAKQRVIHTNLHESMSAERAKRKLSIRILQEVSKKLDSENTETQIDMPAIKAQLAEVAKQAVIKTRENR